MSSLQNTQMQCNFLRDEKCLRTINLQIAVSLFPMFWMRESLFPWKCHVNAINLHHVALRIADMGQLTGTDMGLYTLNKNYGKLSTQFSGFQNGGPKVHLTQAPDPRGPVFLTKG